MRKSLLIILILFAAGCHHIRKNYITHSYELNNDWQFSQEGTNEWYPATVPGVVHLDLLANNLIDDPFWGNNEQKLQWIEQENWIYKTTFQATDTLFDQQHIEIDFEGLDTYATVYLNGDKLFEANNMFREWSQEVKNLLIPGENELKIIFQSPVQHNKKKVETYPYSLPSGNETADIPIKVSPFTRKAAYQFGWDWAPRFVTSGIWRAVKLNTWNKARLTNVFTSTQNLQGDMAKMKTAIEVEVDEEGLYRVVVDSIEHLEHLKSGVNYISYTFEINNPKLWWCNGLGEPYLYEQNIKLFQGNRLLDTKKLDYGVRTIELINKPDSIGTSFYFKLNGRPVFMQGANYVPQDVFLPRVKNKQYEKLIKDVKDAHMNMLRVWGGGIYENDIFYNLCDQMGILVWQDFMFAGSLYPDDKEFRENVKQEVAQNIKRLRGHPCIALWCGNNEIEVAWGNWGWQKQYGYSPEDSVAIWNNYNSIFHVLIPDQVKAFDSGRAYTPTTPLSNWGTPENFNHGSMHYWGVWHGREPFENFASNVGRFMVEYGFQSFPELGTLRKVMADSSLSLESTTMQNRQKSYIGNGLILTHIQQYYHKPKSFTEFVELSQKTQARALKMAISAHKQNKPRCMGSLFWQLNDCWPGPSWSVIDYFGNHKLAYDAVKEAYDY